MWRSFVHQKTSANAGDALQTPLKVDELIDLHLSRLTLANNSSRQSENTRKHISLQVCILTRTEIDSRRSAALYRSCCSTYLLFPYFNTTFYIFSFLLQTMVTACRTIQILAVPSFWDSSCMLKSLSGPSSVWNMTITCLPK